MMYSKLLYKYWFPEYQMNDTFRSFIAGVSRHITDREILNDVDDFTLRYHRRKNGNGQDPRIVEDLAEIYDDMVARVRLDEEEACERILSEMGRVDSARGLNR